MKVVYPGRFDPVTNGHLDVIHRGSKLFSELTVAVAENPSKQTLFTASERAELIIKNTKGLKGVSVKTFSGLLIDFLRQEKSSVVLRGLRETSDFSGEFQQAVVNRFFDPDIETVFVMTKADHFYITSSIVKELASYKADVSGFVPKNVASRLEEKFR